jgi:Fe2+/Zn2+ uptake regulation proteins
MGRAPLRRNTRQREVIRQVFTSAGRPLGPQEVVAVAQESIPSLGIATVYRTVKDLIEEGWLISIAVAGTVRFELAEKGHHHHFYCQQCDRTFDIKGCTTDLERFVPKGFVILSHELTINGRCRSCIEREQR